MDQNSLLEGVDTSLETNNAFDLKVTEQQTSITATSLTGLYINGVHYQLVDASTAAGVSTANENLKDLANHFKNYSHSSTISSFIQEVLEKLALNIASAHSNDITDTKSNVAANKVRIDSLQTQLDNLSKRLAQIQFIGEATKENIAAIPDNENTKDALVVAKEQTAASGGLISKAIELKS